MWSPKISVHTHDEKRVLQKNRVRGRMRLYMCMCVCCLQACARECQCMRHCTREMHAYSVCVRECMFGFLVSFHKANTSLFHEHFVFTVPAGSRREFPDSAAVELSVIFLCSSCLHCCAGRSQPAIHCGLSRSSITAVTSFAPAFQ